MKDKKHGFPDYSPLEGDDIRTIPDFYDNLYPTAEKPTSSIIVPRSNHAKKRDSGKNSEKIKENGDENQNYS